MVVLEKGKLVFILPGRSSGLVLDRGVLWPYLSKVLGGVDLIPPIIQIGSISRYRLSNVEGYSQCVLKFLVNEDIQAYEIRVGGAGLGQGVLVDSGGAVSAGTEITVYIDSVDLPYESSWEINIYAQDLFGNWTPYHDER